MSEYTSQGKIIPNEKLIEKTRSKSYNSKYSDELADHIAELYASGDHHIYEICELIGISKVTFYDWKKNRPYFSNALKEAEDIHRQQRIEKARRGLARLIEGGKFTEEKMIQVIEPIRTGVDGQGNDVFEMRARPKEKVTTKKFYMPNPASVFFELCNSDSENYRHAQHIDHTTNGKDINTFEDLRGKSLDEIEQMVDKISELKTLDEGK